MNMTFSTMDKFHQALLLAFIAHRGQQDKSGEPYIYHPLRVMLSMVDSPEIFTEEMRIVALLHDVVEDTRDRDDPVTVERIRITFGDEIAEAIDAITRRPSEPYPDYIARAKANKIARTVKMKDLNDNLDRMWKLIEAGQPNEARRLTNKYLDATTQLRER